MTQALPFEYALVELRERPSMVGRLEERNIAGAGFLLVHLVDAHGKLFRAVFVAVSEVQAIRPLTRQQAMIWSKRLKEFVPIQLVMQAVMKHYDVTLERLLSATRDGKPTRARMVAMYLCVELTGRTQMEIGKEFNRSHSNVGHAWERIRNEIEIYPDTRTDVQRVRASLEAAIGEIAGES